MNYSYFLEYYNVSCFLVVLLQFGLYSRRVPAFRCGHVFALCVRSACLLCVVFVVVVAGSSLPSFSSSALQLSSLSLLQPRRDVLNKNAASASVQYNVKQVNIKKIIGVIIPYFLRQSLRGGKVS